MKNKAIFFDRDGVINCKLENDYVKNRSEFMFQRGSLDLFSLIKRMNYLAIIITNQQCIGKGIITTETLLDIHNYMQETTLRLTGFTFDDIYFCPDLDGVGSKYRKPEVGMFEDAIKKWNIDVEQSYTLGDVETDMIAGKKIGTTTILINNKITVCEYADYIMQDLSDVYLYFEKFNTNNKDY